MTVPSLYEPAGPGVAGGKYFLARSRKGIKEESPYIPETSQARIGWTGDGARPSFTDIYGTQASNTLAADPPDVSDFGGANSEAKTGAMG